MTSANAPQPHLIITVKLGSTLRQKVAQLVPEVVPQLEGGEACLRLPACGDVRVSDVMATLGLGEDDVNLIYRNHVTVTSRAMVSTGDRLAFFPPNFVHFSQFYIKREER